MLMAADGRTLKERCAGIEMLIVDVDGVLTAGDIIHGSPAVELKQFHVRDGAALRWWRKAGKHSGIITGRASPLVVHRAAEVGIEFLMQGAADKGPAYRELLAKAGIDPLAVCYVGDDLPDLAPLSRSGLAVAVADAAVEVRAIAHTITRAAGGRGAVREIVELILRCQGHWDPLVRGLHPGLLNDAPSGQ
jgi:3-deoxy-D-manno-octulosonate 8-phosphate phosphatase (KDO 8-P phosphatase)